MRNLPILLCLALALGIHAPPAQSQATGAQTVQEEAGPWRLACVVDRMTDAAACVLRHRDPVEDTSAGGVLALEIMDRGGMLVPAVTARNLSLDSAMRGLLAVAGVAQIRFDSHRMMEMPCGLEGRNLVCTPLRAEAEQAARQLMESRRVLVRMSGITGGGAGVEPTELALSDTARAGALLRRHQPAGSAPQGGGLDLQGMLNRLQGWFQ